MAEDFRKALSNAVSGVWRTDAGWHMRDQLAKELTSYGKELEKEAEALNLSNRYKEIAKRFNLKSKLKQIYGKPT